MSAFIPRAGSISAPSVRVFHSLDPFPLYSLWCGFLIGSGGEKFLVFLDDVGCKDSTRLERNGTVLVNACGPDLRHVDPINDDA